MMFRDSLSLGTAMITAPLVGALAALVLRADSDHEDFKPIVEAEMPSGFPQVTPVREIQIKRYPAYRKAVADARADRAFWTLFSHIKQNDVAMTAPVEMAWSRSCPRVLRFCPWSRRPGFYRPA